MTQPDYFAVTMAALRSQMLTGGKSGNALG